MLLQLQHLTALPWAPQEPCSKSCGPAPLNIYFPLQGQPVPGMDLALSSMTWAWKDYSGFYYV